MVHPSELLRSNSTEGRQFSAPANIINENAVDCGIAQLPWLKTVLKLERFAKLKVFVCCLSLVGFLHGLILAYFRNTAQVWGAHYDINRNHVDWIIYTNEFLAGLFALAVSYWGNRIHRMSWIGGLAILLSFNCILLMIPESHRLNYNNGTVLTGDNTCNVEYVRPRSLVEFNYIAVVVLGMFQIMYAMASVSFITHGVSYIDDNSTPKQSPAVLGIVLATREIGSQAGFYLSGFPIYFKNAQVFVSAVWICASILAFLAGSLVAMFPKQLPSMIIERVSASILDIASGVVPTTKTEVVDGFFRTLLRLLRNGPLMLHILSFVFMQSALISFAIFENIFNQTQFFVSHRDNASLVNFMMNLLKQPLVAISIIASGMVIARMRPHTRNLVKFNLVIFFLVLIIFACGAFLKCEKKLETEFLERKSHPYCNSHCFCNPTDFQPICVQNKTFFSPCIAGCSSIKEIYNNKIYQNCTCGDSWYRKGNFEGTEGGCNSANCEIMWALFRANNIFLSALISSTLVSNYIIIMRFVRSTDKAVTLGLYCTFLGITPYLPVKSIYDAVSDAFCQYRNGSACQLFSESFGLFLSASTIILMIISIAMVIGVLFLFRSKDSSEETEEASAQELEPMNAEGRGAMPELAIGDDQLDLRLANEARTNSAISSQSRDSLAELENVGDDHDSIGSLSQVNTLNRRMNAPQR